MPELTRGQKAAQTRKKNAAVKRGERMTRGKQWRLAVIQGKPRVFVGTLLETINLGKERIAIFSVPK